MWASAAKLRSSTPSAIRSLDWMESEGGGGGWLATGGEEGTVGISWIKDRAEVMEPAKSPQRVGNVACTAESSLFTSHFNLRGHVGQVQLIRWITGGDKLASYDSWGRLIGWGSRANVLAKEFQISTSIKVTDMQWSHCGYYLFVCGEDGNVQLFSGLNGINLFSLTIRAVSPLSSKAQFVTCSWNHPSTRVALGTQSGDVVLLDPSANGQSISTMTLRQGIPVQTVQWYGPVRDCTPRSGQSYQSQSLSALLTNGEVILFKSASSRHCFCCETGVYRGQAKWNSSHTLMAVVGFREDLHTPVARFLNAHGYVIFTVTEGLPQLPPEFKVPTQCISWAMQDSVLFLALGRAAFSIAVLHTFPSLQFLCRVVIAESLVERSERKPEVLLPLPRKEIEGLETIVSQCIETPLPTHGPEALEALFKPLPPGQRILCLLEQEETASFTGYVLKYEFLGQYIPILRARRKSRKPGKFLQGGYTIEPVPSLLFQQGEGKYYAQEVLQAPKQSNGSNKRPSRSFAKWVKSAFGHRHSREVVDISRRQQQVLDSSIPARNKPATPRLTLAEVEGNPVTNSYQFITSSPFFEGGQLGSLNISTAYMNNRPRSLKISLSLRQWSLEEGAAGQDMISLQSKLPYWNEQHQVYELDFGGRVCRDSIKNFQVETDGHMVLQFGKIQESTYCLDFQAPFSPIQALCSVITCL